MWLLVCAGTEVLVGQGCWLLRQQAVEGHVSEALARFVAHLLHLIAARLHLDVTNLRKLKCLLLQDCTIERFPTHRVLQLQAVQMCCFCTAQHVPHTSVSVCGRLQHATNTDSVQPM
jgi:hypothetical protein